MTLAGLIGAVLVVLAAGATLAALSRLFIEMVEIIREYFRGIYGWSNTRTKTKVSEKSSKDPENV